MFVNVCKHCQRQYIGNKKGFCCSRCVDIDHMRYEQIKAYLKHFPNSNAYQLADALNMTVYTVLKYVEEGSLLFGKGKFERL